MEEDDDDFYGGGARAQSMSMPSGAEAEVKDEQMDEQEEQQEEEDDEEEEDEDDVQFTLEKPEGIKTEPVPRPSARSVPSYTRDASQVPDAKPTAKTSTPLRTESARPSSTAPPAAVKGTLTHNGREGSSYPEVRTSKLDVNDIPTWPNSNKPITALDIDADLAEHSKPWRLPGTDQTDYFNYGFDEYTWTQYCIKQQSMGQTIADQRAADAQMKAMFGGGGGPPGMPGAGGGGGGGPPGGAGGMPGMPDMEQMMQQMMQQGMNPQNMDFNQFMQMAGGMPGMSGPQSQQQGQFGGGQGGFGSGQNSVSPAPGPGGFQPPSGPQQGGQQGGFNMDGYSPQQLAIMNEQSGIQGGRGRGRRGRGFY